MSLLLTAYPDAVSSPSAGGISVAQSGAGPNLSGKNVRRLVVLGSSITALAIAREAHGLGLQPVVVDVADGIAHQSSLVQTPRFRAGSETENLRQLCELGGTDACLISTADLWISFLRRNRDALERAFLAILHPPNESLDICLSKTAFADWCLMNQLRTPKYCRGDDAARLRDIVYPVLVRPAETLHDRQNSGIPKAVEARSTDELSRLLETYRAAGVAAIVAESLLGQRLVQYSVPFARRDTQTLSFVARKVRPPAEWCSTGTCVELSPELEVESLARKAVEALDYFGIGEVEILHSLDTGYYYFVEINARPWLQYALATASGHNFLAFMLGLDQPTAAPIKQRLTWLNFSGDAYVCFSKSRGIVRRGALPLLEYLKSILRANVYARFSWRDPKPWLVESVSWLRSLANR